MARIYILTPTPFLTGTPQLVKLITEDVEGLTGGKIESKINKMRQNRFCINSTCKL
jgi:hydroxylamine reductase (hybrid-cluster protein)